MQQPYTTTSRRVALLSWLVLFPLVFLLCYRNGGPALATDDLDPSWAWAMANGFEHGLRWGRDIVFTYGPLGFLHPGADVWLPLEQTYRLAQIAIALVQAAAVAALFALVDTRRRIALPAALWIGAVGATGDVIWSIVPVFFLLAIFYQSSRPQARATLYALVAAGCLYVALIATIKVSNLVSGALWCVCASAILLLHRRPRLALACLAGVPGAMLAFWLLAGQQAGDFSAHLAYALMISAGYGSAMSAMPAPVDDLFGAVTIGACALVVLHALWRHRRTPAAFVATAYFGACLFLAWRIGYTRADLHMAIFFCVVLFLLPQLPRVQDGKLRPANIPSVLVAMLSAVLFLRLWVGMAHIPLDAALGAGVQHVRGSWADLVDPASRQPVAQAMSAAAKAKYALPAIRAEVGRSTVDLVGYQQGVLALNGLNYAPRPIPQSYSAYTATAARLNEKFLIGSNAPDYVMLPFSPIDGHPATSEDPLSVIALLRRYVPVLVESKYLLLKKVREPLPRFAMRPPAESQVAMLGAWVDVPGDGATALAFDAELNAAGSAVAFLAREPYWFIDVGLDDGTSQRFRITRGAGETGFLLSPLVANFDDWLRLFFGEPMPRVARFRLLPQSERLGLLTQAEYSYSFTPLDAADRPPAAQATWLADVLYPGFDPHPASREGAVYSIEEEGRRALFTHSPSVLAFALPAGSYVVEGEAGVRKAALTAPECKPADGVEIGVQAGDGDVRPLLTLDPFAHPEAANPARFRSAVLTLPAPGTIRYRVDARANDACDWAYVRDLKIVATPDTVQ